ncbi:MAG: hypothetical protein EB084_21530, partial [Proteobacteria bacterium]|nr:hypothetical protein [Pseudomonadota bacterium]
ELNVPLGHAPCTRQESQGAADAARHHDGPLELAPELSEEPSPSPLKDLPAPHQRTAPGHPG